MVVLPAPAWAALRFLSHAAIDMGDETSIIPACAAAAVVLVLSGRTARGAGLAAWLLACTGAIAATKLALMTCHAGSGRAFSPSGHAACSAFAGQAMAGLLTQPGTRSRILSRYAAGGLSVVVCVALFGRHWHTVGETVAGFAWGSACAAGDAVTTAGGTDARTPRAAKFAMGCVLVAGLAWVATGHRSDSEVELRSLAGGWSRQGWFASCPASLVSHGPTRPPA
jgi:hypothetical protein